MVEIQLTDKDKLDLAIQVAKEVIPPTINLIKGRLIRKSAQIRLQSSAVFTFYGSISIEEYNSIFVKKISESKTDKNKLEIDGITVGYFISPNVKAVFPVVLEAEYGERILKEEEIMSLYTRIDQIRLFIHPSQEQEMSLEELERFVKAFDNFIEKVELCLRGDKKIPLNMVVKHLVFESENTEFLEKASRPTTNECVGVYRCNGKVSVTYTKLEKLLEFIRGLW